MRILHFYKTYYPDSMGGVQQVINQLARSMQPLGIESEVLTLSHKPHPCPLSIDGHDVHQVKTHLEIASTSFSLTAFSCFSELAKRADVIHYHYPWPFMDMVHFATKIKKPTVVTYHSDIVKQKTLLKFYKPLQRRFLASVDRIAVNSPNYLESSDVLPAYRDKAVIIPYGLDKSTYPAVSEKVVDHWCNQMEQRFFLFLGVLRYYKGLHVLLEALKDTNYPVVIVGDGPMDKQLKAQAKQLGLKNVYFLGALSNEDKAALFQLCYAVVFPSHLRSEAFGISLLEGAMYGKPMISCEIGTGTSFVNLHLQTGLVVKPDDPSSLREAMSYLWNNCDIAKEMGKNAEKRYLDVFTSQLMAKNYAQLYNSI